MKIKKINNKIILKPTRETISLSKKEGIVIYSGEITGDITTIVKKIRMNDLKKLYHGKRNENII
ncbi:hypothetical protein HY745_06040 [Candidatus Desantisbacteria bacterium]|nr:hypothetical protein [Candidatus Desantisbacteria bacterium]